MADTGIIRHQINVSLAFIQHDAECRALSMQDRVERGRGILWDLPDTL